ncbi:MAG: NAD(P)/FAD-dependent oxidoreductase [Bacteroidia bacterium]
MKTNQPFDCAIVGGGLAGLCLSIQLAKKNFRVIVFEKNTYPFHKVCGEYISMESWDFLENLGLPLSQMRLPIINKLHVTAQNGFQIASKLEMGGFGISRHTLDFELVKLARQVGVVVLENCKVQRLVLQNEFYTIEAGNETYQSRVACGAYGKIDPAFVTRETEKQQGGYVAVKYHIKTNFPDDLIELHNFKDGYCGISKVDLETYCLCYLTTTKNLQAHNNDIKLMEEHVLMKNPVLRRYFSEATFLYDKPLAISKIGFQKKQAYRQDMLMLGDAAGAIAPLCGNGMSIGMRASKILAECITEFLEQRISKEELIARYTKAWNANFSLRIKTGYYLQKLFGKRVTTLWALKLLNRWPRLLRKLISFTHGQKFG